MKAKTLQITWHAKAGRANDPIFSIDFHPELPLLATGGQDCEIKLWRLVEPGFEYKSLAAGKQPIAAATEPSVDYLFTLVGHEGSVNGVRFSPNGECLASVSDDSTVIIWFPVKGLTWDTVTDARQIQRMYLRGHSRDVYDVAWAPDSRRLVTGSVDNTAIVWDVTKARSVAILEGHTQFVQGVAWDPSGAFIVTESDDRTARVYRAEPEREALVHGAKAGQKRGRPAKPMALAAHTYPCVQVIKAREMDSTEASTGTGAGAASSKDVSRNRHHMFMDDTAVTSFFRRPAFTPDGSLLLLPAGQYRSAPDAAARPTTWIFARDQGAKRSEGGKEAGVQLKPLCHLPVCTGTGSALRNASVLTRTSPVLYTPRSTRRAKDGEAVTDNGAFSLPYRMMWAVGTLDAVLVYDSQHPHPLAAVANMHYDKLMDLAWSPSGRILLLASYDGYCSMVVFDGAEVGERLPAEAMPHALRSCLRKQPSFPPPKAKKARVVAVAGSGTASSSAAGDADPATPEKEAEGGAVLDAGAEGADVAEACVGEGESAVEVHDEVLQEKPVKRKIALTLVSTFPTDVAASAALVSSAPVPTMFTSSSTSSSFATPLPAPVPSALASPTRGSIVADIQRVGTDAFGNLFGAGSVLGQLLAAPAAVGV